MNVTDERVLCLADGFSHAAIQGRGWYEALDRFAKATGSTTGELIGIGSNAAIPFNIMTGIDPGFQVAFAEAGGGDPQINPRVQAGSRLPLLRSAVDSEFITPHALRRNTHYQEFAIPWDVPHICLATLDRDPQMLVGVAVVRTARDGPISRDQRAVFDALTPHIRTAVRTQMVLENQGAALLSRAFEGLSMAAFVCDKRGRVRLMTPVAEKLLNEGGVLNLRNGVLSACRRDRQAALSAAVEAVSIMPTRPGVPVAQTVILHNNVDGQPLLLDLVRLSKPEHELSFSPHLLIVARAPRSERNQRERVLREAFGLTWAEADIALRIGRGESPLAIAQARAVSLGTVRIQIKSVMFKLGVRRQAEIAAKLAFL